MAGGTPIPIDAFLVIVVVVMAALIGVSVVLLMVKFGHPDDKNVAKLPKVVTFLGLWLAFASMLIMPYDIANSRGSGGGVRVDILWQILYICIAIFVFALVPFAVFFYESDTDPEDAKKGCCASQLSQAVCYSSIFFVIFATIVLILYAVLGKADIPVENLTHGKMFPIVGGQAVTEVAKASDVASSMTSYWTIPVTLPVFLIAAMSFVGWFAFAMFVGVGLVALPFDLINEFRTRPAPMSTKMWVEEKQKLGARAKELIEIGQKFKDRLDKQPDSSRSERRADKKNYLKFEQNFYFLKRDYAMLDLSHRLKGGNPLWPIFKLLLGCLGVLVSLTWIVHICIFLLPATPLHPFLNSYFVILSPPAFPLFGICAFAAWSLYLLWCCIKGNFKLGLRFLFWKIYPMEVNNTLMNAFLVNTWLILLCSVPAVQFCTVAFPVYARLTDVDMLFGTQVQYLRFFNFFWDNNVFVFAMMAMSFLTLIAVIVRPNDASAKIDAEIKAIGKKKNYEL